MVLSSGNSSQSNCSRTNSVVALSGKEQISPVLLLSDNAPKNHEIEQTHLANVIRCSLRNRKTMVSDKQCDNEPKFVAGIEQTNGSDYLSIMPFLPKTSSPSLMSTILKKSVPRVFPCSECDQGFLSENNLQRHKASHHSKQLPSDTKSSVTINNKLKRQSPVDPSLTKRMKGSLSVDKNFEFQEDLMLQTNKSGEKFFQCDICHLSFNLPKVRELRIHYLRNHISYQFISDADRALCAIVDDGLFGKLTDQLYRCHTCHVSFPDKQDLIKHNVEHQRSTYICDQCKAVFHQNKAFSNHLQMCTTTSEEANSTPESKELLCLFCKVFNMVLNTEEQNALHTREFHCHSNGFWRSECMFGCSFKHKRPKFLFHHYCTAHKDEYYGCFRCKVRFTSLKIQKSHDLKHHNVKLTSPKLTCDTKVPLTCHNTSNGGMKSSPQNNMLPSNLLNGHNGNQVSLKIPISVNGKSSPSSTTKPSGTSSAAKPNGASTTKPNGSLSTTKPNGSLSTAKPNGASTTKTNGSSSTKPSGSSSTAKPNGASTTKPSGSSSTAKPNGASSNSKSIVNSSSAKSNGTSHSALSKTSGLKTCSLPMQGDKSISISKKAKTASNSSGQVHILSVQQKHFQNAFLKSITKMDIVQQVSVLKKHAEQYPDMFHLPDHQLFYSTPSSQSTAPVVDLLEEEDFIRPVFTSSYENQIFICKACGVEFSQIEDINKHFTAAHPFIKNDYFVFDKDDVPPNFWNLYCPANSYHESKIKMVGKTTFKCVSCGTVSKCKEDFHKHLLLCASKSKCKTDNTAEKPRVDIPQEEEKTEDNARRKMVITGVVREVPDDPLFSYKLQLGKTINKPGDSETVYNMLNKLPSKRLVKTTERYNSLQYINNKAMKPKRSSAERVLMNTKDSYVSLDEYIEDFVYINTSRSSAIELIEKSCSADVEEIKPKLKSNKVNGSGETEKQVEKKIKLFKSMEDEISKSFNEKKSKVVKSPLLTEDVKNIKMKKPKSKNNKQIVEGEMSQVLNIPKPTFGNADLKSKIKVIKTEIPEVTTEKNVNMVHSNLKDLITKSSLNSCDKKRKFNELDKPNQVESPEFLDLDNSCNGQETIKKLFTSNNNKSVSKQLKKLKIDMQDARSTSGCNEKIGQTKSKKAVLVEKKNKQNTVKKKIAGKNKVKIVQNKVKSLSIKKVKNNNKVNACDSNNKSQNKSKKKMVKLK